jgi:hypothetical protein
MLMHVKAAWNECPTGHIPILLGDLNIKLESLQNEQDERVAKHVGNVMGLVDLSASSNSNNEQGHRAVGRGG